MLSEIRFMLLRASALFILLALPAVVLADTPESGEAADAKISYYQQIRPILQAHCHGCHQPAKANGQFVMTAFEPLVAGGESGSAAVVPGKPDESYLIEQITPEDGEALMPPDKPPLADAQVALIRRWIEQGAADDSPVHVRQRYDMDHPPVYVSPPVITSLDYSPDGTLLAIAGFHEVLLTSVDGGETVARLVGLAERIESVRFSPDGTLLAVAGGLPGRMGELQVWDVAKRRLKLSLPVTFDTIYGGNWSPDGKQIAVGGGDNSVRAIEVESGREVVYMAAHEDWVRGTVFSADGKSIFSAGRDMTVKMTDVATQRFVGNVTTHTPGVLRGGQLAIRRHPVRSELLVGGADGAPKLFQMDVKAAPASGGNPNQIREYEALPGRVFDVGFHPDGSRIYAGSSLDGAGRVRCFETDSGKRLWDVPLAEASIYALACSPDGTTLAAAGSDGQIRLLDAASGQPKSTFMPFEIQAAEASGDAWSVPSAAEPQSAEPSSQPSLPPLAAIAVEPAAIQIGKPTDYVQILVFGDTPDGQRWDVTRLAQYRVAGDVGQVTGDGRFLPAADGSGRIVVSVGDRSVEIPVHVQGMTAGYTPDFHPRRQSDPVAAGLQPMALCHGSAAGRNGFKLSLRGYDALFDIRSLTDDSGVAAHQSQSPDDSLMLLKATGCRSAPRRRADASRRQLLPSPAQLDRQRRAAGSVHPARGQDRRAAAQSRRGPARQHPADARHRDLRRRIDPRRDSRGVRRDRQRRSRGGRPHGSDDRDPPRRGSRAGPLRRRLRGHDADRHGRPDRLCLAGTRDLGPDRRVGRRQMAADEDSAFAALHRRRVHPPRPARSDRTAPDGRRRAPVPGRPARHPHETRRAGGSTDRQRGFHRVLDEQVGRPAAGQPQVPGSGGGRRIPQLDPRQLATSQPYDQFVREILTASGSNRENPAASYYKILRDPLDTMENTTHLFLGVRFNCNKCHDHPFERWTQDQYYQTAAFFARLELKPDPAAGDKKIGGTAVEGPSRCTRSCPTRRRAKSSTTAPGRWPRPNSPSTANTNRPKTPRGATDSPLGSPRPTTRTSPAATSIACGATCWASA
jgi:mono/diheme cytochrome c family protein